jgi:hypothetical protein
MSSWLTNVVDKAAGVLSHRKTRRSFLAGTAVVGSALVVSPKRYLMEPVSAIGSICGPAATADAGYTAFCCSIYRGENKCPAGTFVGGWWRADGSSYCCTNGQPGSRYYIDCQAECKGCANGCNPFCSQSCWNCQPHAASGSCDQRRVCQNVFRYGQCNTQIACSGPVACRVVTCAPPYLIFPSCGRTTLFDNTTANHTAPCLSGACA